jgi:uncharacterized protein
MVMRSFAFGLCGLARSLLILACGVWKNLKDEGLPQSLVHNCAYNESMSYQWDKEKAAANVSKHGIDFADAVTTFSDDCAITLTDERFEEERFITIGRDALGRILVVVYTWRGNEIRLISARKAMRHERTQYEEG